MANRIPTQRLIEDILIEISDVFRIHNKARGGGVEQQERDIFLAWAQKGNGGQEGTGGI